MHQYLQRLRSYQGPLATPSFGLTSSSRRHNKRSKGSHVTVSANHAQGQVRKLQNQHKTPKQGLPTEGRKPGLPATSVPPRNAKPDVSASDRTLNVIVRVCKTCKTRLYNVACVIYASKASEWIWVAFRHIDYLVPCAGPRRQPASRSSLCPTALESHPNRGQTRHSCTRQSDQGGLPSRSFDYLPS